MDLRDCLNSSDVSPVVGEGDGDLNAVCEAVNQLTRCVEHLRLTLLAIHDDQVNRGG